MSIELLAMLGGGVSGFLMKLIASQAEAQQHLEPCLDKIKWEDSKRKGKK